jgi:hypothetical protein
MALSISLTAGKSFQENEKITNAKLNQLVGGAEVTLEGQVSTTELEDRSVTPVKGKHGAWFYSAGGGTASAHTVTTGSSLAAYADGLILRYKVPGNSTGAVTLNVDGLGAKNLYKLDGATAIAAGDLRLNQVIEVVYNSSLNGGAGGWHLIGQPANSEVIYGEDAGANDSYVITPTPNLLGYAAGQRVVFKANTANTGEATLNVSGLGAKKIYKEATRALEDGDIRGGQLLIVAYDTTLDSGNGGWQLLTPVTVRPGLGVSGVHQNLVIKNTSGLTSTSLDVTADEILLRDSGGRLHLASGVSLSVAITASGANGLDTGLEANSTWYYIHVIYNGTTVAGLLSTSRTSPTLPGAYTYRALVGAVYNDSAGNFKVFHQLNRRVHIDKTVLFTAKSAAANNTYEALAGADLDLFKTMAPPIAKTAFGTMGNVHTATGSVGLGVAGDGDGRGEMYTVGTALTATRDSFTFAAPFEVPLMTEQNFFWKATHTGTGAFARIVVTGYTI